MGIWILEINNSRDDVPCTDDPMLELEIAIEGNKPLCRLKRGC